MIIEFKNNIKNTADIMEIDRTNPYNVAALLPYCLSFYKKDDDKEFYNSLEYLMGEFNKPSNLLKQNIKDRMMQNSKYEFIGASYFYGATPQNNYTPDNPLKVEVFENIYSKTEEGYIRLLLKSGGADSLRRVTLRKAKDNNYYLWSDSILSLLADIRPRECDNPWA